MTDRSAPKLGAQQSYAHEACRQIPLTQSGSRDDNTQIRVITQSFADDVVVNAKELAHALRVSRWTLARWREEGYQFEFGNRSTPGHLKAWLRERAAQRKPKVTELSDKLARLR
jgi:hypothetical protein